MIGVIQVVPSTPNTFQRFDFENIENILSVVDKIEESFPSVECVNFPTVHGGLWIKIDCISKKATEKTTENACQVDPGDRFESGVFSLWASTPVNKIYHYNEDFSARVANSPDGQTFTDGECIKIIMYDTDNNEFPMWYNYDCSTNTVKSSLVDLDDCKAITTSSGFEPSVGTLWDDGKGTKIAQMVVCDVERTSAAGIMCPSLTNELPDAEKNNKYTLTLIDLAKSENLVESETTSTTTTTLSSSTTTTATVLPNGGPKTTTLRTIKVAAQSQKPPLPDSVVAFIVITSLLGTAGLLLVASTYFNWTSWNPWNSSAENDPSVDFFKS